VPLPPPRPQSSGNEPEARAPANGFRWVVCALLFAGTTINYIDRQVIGLLKPTLMADLGWSQIDYGDIVFAFQAAYAIGYGGGGWFMDRVGVKLGYATAVFGWSIAAVLHGVVRTVSGFSLVRFGLGLAEGGNFPAAIKAVTEWFPAKERALATGIFNAGSNVAVVITPLIVPWIANRWGWPAAFYVTGALGFFWLLAWGALYRRPPWNDSPSVDGDLRVPSTGSQIQSAPGRRRVSPRISWLSLLRHRQTWAFIVGMAATSPVWWFYLFWVPGFLHEKHGLSLTEFGPPLIAIYLVADVGSVGGGWLSSWLLARGWSVNAARKTAMLACALCVVPVFAASSVTNFWAATALIGLAAAAHQGFAANLYTLVSDTAPGDVVSSIVGIGGMASAIVAMFSAKLIGYLLETTGSYVLLFAGASVAYGAALLVIHLLNPRLEPMQISDQTSTRG